MAPNPTQFPTSFKCSRMVIRAEYSSVAVTGEKEGPLALRRGYITPNIRTVSYRRGVKLNFTALESQWKTLTVLQRVGQHAAARAAELTPRQWKLRYADNPPRSALHTLVA